MTTFQITPIAIHNIYYKFYVILAVFNVCMAMVLWFLYPETKQLSLEELDFYFAKKYGNEASLKEVEMESPKQTGSVKIENLSIAEV